MHYLHRSVWNPGPLPENVEPSLSSAGSLPNDSSESNNSSSIRYVSFTNERVEMNKSVQWTIVQSPFTEYVTRRFYKIPKRFTTKRNSTVLLITLKWSYQWFVFWSTVFGNVAAQTERCVEILRFSYRTAINKMYVVG